MGLTNVTYTRCDSGPEFSKMKEQFSEWAGLRGAGGSSRRGISIGNNAQCERFHEGLWNRKRLGLNLQVGRGPAWAGKTRAEKELVGQARRLALSNYFSKELINTSQVNYTTKPTLFRMTITKQLPHFPPCCSTAQDGQLVTTSY